MLDFWGRWLIGWFHSWRFFPWRNSKIASIVSSAFRTVLSCNGSCLSWQIRFRLSVSSLLVGHERMWCSTVSGVWHFSHSPVGWQLILNRTWLSVQWSNRSLVINVSFVLLLLSAYLIWLLTVGWISNYFLPVVPSFHLFCQIFIDVLSICLYTSSSSLLTTMSVSSWLSAIFAISSALSFPPTPP